MITDNNVSYLESGKEKLFDFKKIYWIFKKYFKFVFIITIFSYFFGDIIYRSKPKIYSGQFQVLISNENKTNGEVGNLQDLLSNRNTNNTLKTQIEILKSKSVLLPLSGYIKSLRNEIGINSEKVSFNSIKNNIQIKILPGTTLLNVNFKSQYIEEILPVLEKISYLYQNVPTKDKTELLDNSIQFLNGQIRTLKKENEKLFLEIEEFSKKYDFSFYIDQKNNSSIVINTEENILNASTRIREIEENIGLLKEKANNEFEFLALSKIIIPSSLSMTLLEENSVKLVEARSIFEDKSENIRDLIDTRKYLFAQHIKNVINYLESEMKLSTAKIRSNKRPIEALNKFKSLIRKYQRQNSKISSFESQIDNLIFEKASSKSEWEIITEPQVYPAPVSPDKRILLTLSIFIGFFGSLVSIYLFVRNKSTFTFSSEIEEVLDLPELFKLNGAEIEKWQETINLFLNCNKNINKSNKIRFLILGNNDDIFLKEFIKIIDNIKDEKKVEITNILSSNGEDIPQILLIINNGLKKSEIYDIRKKLDIQDYFNLGYIVIYPNKNSFYDL